MSALQEEGRWAGAEDSKPRFPAIIKLAQAGSFPEHVQGPVTAKNRTRFNKAAAEVKIQSHLKLWSVKQKI